MTNSIDLFKWAILETGTLNDLIVGLVLCFSIFYIWEDNTHSSSLDIPQVPLTDT